MSLKIFSNKQKIPEGYIEYSKGDFELYFGVSEEIAHQLEEDYVSLVNPDSKNNFTEFVIKAGRDLYSITNELVKRYGVNRAVAGNIALYFANISSSVVSQSNRKNLGITQCIWLGSACSVRSKDNAVSHKDFDGKKFDRQRGILTPDGYVFPGAALGCLCTCRVVLPI